MTGASDTGFRLGVLMLETRFPRPVGDIGNPASFPFDVIYDVVPGAAVGKVITGRGLAPELVDMFAERARGLEREGAKLVTTGCGFLIPHQDALRRAVTVPVVASSLCLLPYLRTVLPPGGQIGILTFDGPKLAETLSDEDKADLVIEGLENGSELHPVISQDRETLDIEAARADVAAAARRLADRAPDLAAVVLECTNLPPYRDVIDRAFSCRIYDIRDMILWHAGPGTM